MAVPKPNVQTIVWQFEAVAMHRSAPSAALGTGVYEATHYLFFSQENSDFAKGSMRALQANKYEDLQLRLFLHFFCQIIAPLIADDCGCVFV